MNENAPLLRLAEDLRLAWRSWDGEIVLLNEASGDTHRLDVFASAAFEALLQGPTEHATLLGQLGEDLGVTDKARLEASLAAALSQFAQLGLLA
jgi:PqqD family protein of HPr-rel-A system